MITAKHLPTSQIYASDNLFSLTIKHQMMRTLILMKVNTETINTRDIPWTVEFLERNLPSILSSKCFNAENIPFSIEVTRTEIGHLFEHILLEYLCEEKLLTGSDEAVFSGKTMWNWEKDPVGLFHICINMQITDLDIFPTALDKSMQLMERMIKHDTIQEEVYPVREQAFPSPVHHAESKLL